MDRLKVMESYLDSKSTKKRRVSSNEKTRAHCLHGEIHGKGILHPEQTRERAGPDARRVHPRVCDRTVQQRHRQYLWCGERYVQGTTQAGGELEGEKLR